MNTNTLKTIALATVAGITIGSASVGFAADSAGAGIGGGAGGAGSDIVVNGGTITSTGGGVGEVTPADLATKVNKSDIVNNLTSTATDKPLSANQGKVLNDGKVSTSRKVNGHALTSDVTVTKSDVSLGNVVNTSDSATPVSGGTTKFTTGGAYTELNKKISKSGDTMTGSLSFKASQSDIGFVGTDDVYFSCIRGYQAGALEIGRKATSGTYWFSGPELKLHPAGSFDLSATDDSGSNRRSLSGASSGALTWDGANVARSKKASATTLSAHITTNFGFVYVGGKLYAWTITESTGAVTFSTIGGTSSITVKGSYTKDASAGSSTGSLPGTITFTASSSTTIKVICD